ncbi:hypothetical protein V7S43_004206 [Phytophthora oleae]|uniref:Telomeric single stranded DNA binding POT1/Cdc13 domain-containing protein n=1 Tax=Phytophthora oleae TaxID=2107226 RepID=A0ABD3FXB0_9STRA
MPPKTQREKDAAGKQVADNVPAGPPSQPTTNYQSPLKSSRARSTSTSARLSTPSTANLREFTTHIDGKDKVVCASVRIKARLLWIAPDTVAGLHFLRLYFGECQAPGPLEEQQQPFKPAQREDPLKTNQFLISVLLLKVDMYDPKLPHPGDVVMITQYKLNVYRNCCQVDAKLYGLTKIDIP